METLGTLEPGTKDALKRLYDLNVDSVKGYETAAEAIEDERFASYFREMALERVKHVGELGVYLELNDEKAQPDGTLAGKAHRFWIELRGKAQMGDAKAVLSEAERGEDKIKKEYEELIVSTAGSPLNDVLLRQYGEVKKTHDTVKALRDTRD